MSNTYTPAGGASRSFTDASFLNNQPTVDVSTNEYQTPQGEATTNMTQGYSEIARGNETSIDNETLNSIHAVSAYVISMRQEKLLGEQIVREDIWGE